MIAIKFSPDFTRTKLMEGKTELPVFSSYFFPPVYYHAIKLPHYTLPLPHPHPLHAFDIIMKEQLLFQTVIFNLPSSSSSLFSYKRVGILRKTNSSLMVSRYAHNSKRHIQSHEKYFIGPLSMHVHVGMSHDHESGTSHKHSFKLYNCFT